MAIDPNLAKWQTAADDGLEFGKNAYLEAIPDLANVAATARGASGLQGGLSRSLAKQSLGLQGRMAKFEGMQDQYAADAANYNSPQRQAQVAGQATADVAQKFGSMRDQANRQLSRSGVDPGSGRSLALGNQMQYAQASSEAYAGNKARNDLEAVANDRQRTAIGFGANLGTQALQSATASSGLANSAISSGAVPLTSRLNFAGGVGDIYGAATGNYKNLYNSQNLTPDQKAIAGRQDAKDSRDEDSAFWSTLGTVFNSKAGQSAFDKGIDWLFG